MHLSLRHRRRGGFHGFVHRLGHLGLRRRRRRPSARSGSGEVIFLGLGLGLGLGAFAASAAAFACARSCCSATMGVMTSMILMAANAAVEPKSARMGSDARSGRASRVRAADGDDRRHSHRGGEEVDRLGGGVRHGVGTLVGTLFGTLVGIVGAVRDETLADDRAEDAIGTSAAARSKLSAPRRACHGTSP